jgi:hypothetical protein
MSMTENRYDTLDDALNSLPREVEPGRDLWPEIRASIKRESKNARDRWTPNPWLQIAAAVVLMIATSATTYLLTRQSLQRESQIAATKAAGALPVNFDPANLNGDALGANYLRARADLDKLFAERIAALPPITRVKLQKNLADLRHAADEIAATLAEHPSDPLLQDLLMSTRQRELQLLADVGQLPTPKS